jgi:hypothetical protein
MYGDDSDSKSERRHWVLLQPSREAVTVRGDRISSGIHSFRAFLSHQRSKASLRPIVSMQSVAFDRRGTLQSNDNSREREAILAALAP